MSSVIEQIKQQQQEAKLKAAADYELLVLALVDGEKAPAKALSILTNAGRTADELQEDVRLATERRRLEPVAAPLEQLAKDRVAAELKFNETAKVYEAKVKEAMQQIQKTILDPANEALLEARARHDQAREADMRLTQIKNEQDRTRALRANPPVIKRMA